MATVQKGNHVRLTWTNPQSAFAINIEKSINDGATWINVGATSVGATALDMGIPDAEFDRDLQFRIRPVGATNCNLVATARVTAPMILKVDTRLLTSATKTVALPLRGTTDVYIDSGDRNAACTNAVKSQNQITNVSCNYNVVGTADIRIYGSLQRLGGWELGVAPTPVGYGALVGVSSFGSVNLQSLRGGFYGAANLTDVPSQLPSSVRDLTSTFSLASKFNDPDIRTWDVSNVTSLAYTFEGALEFNQDLSSWDVSNVSIFINTFKGAAKFNSGLSGWNTSAGTDFSFMFNGATAFNQSIGAWDMSKAISLKGMFWDAPAFNQSLNSWNTSSVDTMYGMFVRATSFNQSIGNWNTSKVTDMRSMFEGATAFNQPLTSVSAQNRWVMTSVTFTSSMFKGASAFNQDLSSWSTGSITHMADMFSGATKFNGTVSNWNTSNVIDMTGMFWAASAFNQDLTGWCVSKISSRPVNFAGAPMTASREPRWGTCR